MPSNHVIGLVAYLQWVLIIVLEMGGFNYFAASAALNYCKFNLLYIGYWQQPRQAWAELFQAQTSVDRLVEDPSRSRMCE